MATKIFLILIIYVVEIYADDIIAYDCADPNVEISKISLLGVKPCTDPRNSSLEERKLIRLVQQRKYTQVHVYTCLVQVQQIVQHCGMFSHISAVDEGFMSYIHKIKDKECKKIHSPNNRYLDLRSLREGLSVYVKPNSTVETSATIAGTLNYNGDCSGVKYTYNGVEYKDVIVTANIKIQLKDYMAVADIEQNSVKLRNGAVCPYSHHYCFDDEAGEVTWDIWDHTNECSKNNFDILYQGYAKLLTLTESKSKYIVVETNDTVFALRLLSQEIICFQQVWRTEQTRLGVIFLSSSSAYYDGRSQRIISQNIDILDHVVTKLLYLQIALQTQSRDLIYDSIKKRCELREQILQNRLALAYSSPDVVSSLVKEASGHIGRIMGEVLYVVRCIPKIVKYRPTKECYQELPITYNNKNQFMVPITHIIQEHGTQINCDKNMPSMVYVGGKWLQFDPHIRHSYPIPVTLNANNPNEKVPSMKIVPIDSNGIFTKEEMENFKQTVFFPNEREAISNIVARRIIGIDADNQGFSFPNIFSKMELSSMAKSTAHAIWGVFSGIASYIPVIGVSLISIGLVKYLIGVIFNYFMLKTTANTNPFVTMGASLWNMLTRLLMFRSAQKTQRKQEEANTLDASNNNSEPLLTKPIYSETIV